MEKRTIEMAILLDIYGELLTEKQKTCLDFYYNEDFSLAEIAELSGVTRQGVLDAIRRGEAALLAFEQKIGLQERIAEMTKATERIAGRLRRIEEKIGTAETTAWFAEIYGDLESITEKAGED